MRDRWKAVLFIAISCTAVMIQAYLSRPNEVPATSSEKVFIEKVEPEIIMTASDLNLVEELQEEIPKPEPVTQEDLEEEIYYDSLELLAICVEAEAGNQELIGKRMVVDVILNRVDDPDWPDTVEGVITQKNQFSSYLDGAMERVYEPAESTYEAVKMELEERGWPELYYFTADGYGAYGTPWKQVGDHFFCTK